MTLTEILIIAFGFFLGYWVIANLIGAKPRASGRQGPQDRGTDP